MQNKEMQRVELLAATEHKIIQKKLLFSHPLYTVYPQGGKVIQALFSVIWLCMRVRFNCVYVPVSSA
jgi:hypothetical protein